MANDKLTAYYWQIMSYLADCLDDLAPEHSAFVYPDEDETVLRGRLKGVLVFRDESHLFARAELDDTANVREYNYAYVYYGADGKRIFQYDDSPHHPEIATYPHHLHRGVKTKRERIQAIDVPQVDFITIVTKIIERLQQEK